MAEESPLSGRAGRMASSLGRAARGHGFPDAEVRALVRALALAMAPRKEALGDDHHPAYLHPGRAPLILLRDVGPVDISVLVVACIHESVDAELRIPVERVEAALGNAAVRARETIPLPGDERLVERLLTLGPGVSMAALAEHLDHLRHLHLREDLIDSWADVHAEVLAAWLPFARRVHEKLATRYAHWARTFVRRI